MTEFWPQVRRNFLAAAGIFFPMVAGVVSLASVYLLFGASERMPFFVESALDRNQNEEIASLRGQIDDLKGDLYTEGEPVSAVDSSRVTAIEERQKALDDALSEKADRVIALAAMRKDLDDLIENQKTQVISLQEQVAELRTILLSLAGTIIAILIAFVGWLIVRRQSGNE